MTDHIAVLDRRRAGILLHPTSLPGGEGNGDLGAEAYRFVEFLAAAGQSVWQTLPVGPTHIDGSPYLALSVHAGSPLLISLEFLVEQGWLPAIENPGNIGLADPRAYRERQLVSAYRGFRQQAASAEREAFAAFSATHVHWLNDYALYVALKREHGDRAWMEWPVAMRDREPAALAAAATRLHESVAQIRFEQFVFFDQWRALKRYANEHGVRLFGDMPIFVAHDSAEVWRHRDYFDLDERGQARVIAGVPPDYFSATGQRWGNPHYRWDRIQADGFRWWRDRLHTQLQLFDLIRIDHFRGLEAYWEIPADCDTAVNGRWVTAPGDALFQTLQGRLGRLPLVAEDLGLITPEVHALRRKYGLPGMKVLQFAFDGGPENPYLPHHHEVDAVVYTGTHDNDTTLGWFTKLATERQGYVMDYLGSPGEPMPWPLVRCALASVAKFAVIPLQDILMLGSDHRMNRPGTQDGNWRWRFSWDQFDKATPARLRHLTELYGRVGD